MQYRRIFGLKSDETEIGIASTDDGRLKVDADISGGLDSADLATQTTLAAVLAKIIAAPSTDHPPIIIHVRAVFIDGNTTYAIDYDKNLIPLNNSTYIIYSRQHG